MTIIQQYYIETPYTGLSECVQKMVDDSADQTRIYLLLTGILASLDIARYLYSIKADKFAEYALISVNYDEYYETVQNQMQSNVLISQSFENATIEDARNVYHKAILVLAPSPANFTKFCDLMVKRIRKRLHNLTELGKSNCKNVQAALVYDAMVIYARTIGFLLKSQAKTSLTNQTDQTDFKTNNFSEKNFTTKDYKQVFASIVNRTYESVLGFNYFIGRDGEADGNYTLLSFVGNDSKKLRIISMESQPYFANIRPIGVFEHNRKSSLLDFVAKTSIDWLKRNATQQDEPECGINDEKCIKSNDFLKIVIAIFFFALVVAFISFLARFLLSYDQQETKLWEISLNEIRFLEIDRNQDFRELNRAIAVSTFC